MISGLIISLEKIKNQLENCEDVKLIEGDVSAAINSTSINNNNNNNKSINVSPEA